ncbi:MAG: hypothetical protein AMJ79_07475 [Phycisphaerae bacterium SM23_30]|nr:MAG: hypothetical protein AMJ79_07475 [Phycisphaerae bacterium SM23_30]
MLLLAVVCVCFAESRNNYEISIAISPNTLALGSEGVWVTVHTDISYYKVEHESLTLNEPSTLSEIEIAWTKADSRGNLVAKFDIDQVKEAVKDQVGQQVELILKGDDIDGVPFEGSDYINVKK